MVISRAMSLRHGYKIRMSHCVKSVHIRSYSSPHFPHSDCIWRDIEYLSIFSIQSKCGKMRTRVTPNMDTFDALSTGYILIANIRSDFKS